MASKTQSSAKGNPASKRMMNAAKKAKRASNKFANERAAAAFAKDHPEVINPPHSRTTIRNWLRHSAPRVTKETDR